MPWCTCQDDHLQDETGPYHFGPEHTVTLTLPDGDPREPTVSPSQLNVYLEQLPQDREARVAVCRDEKRGVYLTLADAGELADALSDAIREAAAAGRL